MYRISFSKSKPTPTTKVIASIGNFDGVHLGHQKLLKQLNQNLSNAWRILISFDTLPHEYFANQTKSPGMSRISLLRDKIKLFVDLNLCDEVIILHFNSHLAKLSPSEFIQNYLIKRLKISHMVIGHDFRFSVGASGSYTDLSAHGIQIYKFHQIKKDNKRISSSIIRNLALKQDLTTIREYLGHSICYTSRIVYGNQLGRKYGVPTINLNLARIKPMLWGIYTGFVYIENTRYNAVVSIGKNPTLTNNEIYKVEAHLLDVDLMLYGKIATVEILEYLRNEIKFNDLESLFKQIYQDLIDTRTYFANI